MAAFLQQGYCWRVTIYARFQTPVSVDLAKASTSASVSYGAERGKLELGVCEVSIPKSHEVGELESPSVLRLEFHEDPNRHVMLVGIQSRAGGTIFREPSRLCGAIVSEIRFRIRARV